MLRSLKRFGFNSNELCVVYKGYVRPLVEYADVVWHSSLTINQSNTIEKVQKTACRIILGYSYTSYNDALNECGIESLVDRRKGHCLKFAAGLSQCPQTKDLIPPNRKEAHGRELRNSSSISNLSHRTARFSRSPVPYFIELLNV